MGERINPEKIFKHVEILKIKTGEESIDIIKQGMLNNFYLNSGCDDFEDDEDFDKAVESHKAFHNALESYGKVFSWESCTPSALNDLQFGAVFRAFGEDGFENVYMILANDEDNLLWIPVAKTNTPMCVVWRWIGHLNGEKAKTTNWLWLGYFRMEDVAEIMEENAKDGHFYKITTVNGTPLEILGEDEDYEEELNEDLAAIYQAVHNPETEEMDFISANFVLRNERLFAGLSEEWHQLITKILGEDPYEEKVEVIDEEEPEEDAAKKAGWEVEMKGDSDGETEESKPEDYKAEEPEKEEDINSQLDSLFK